MTAVQMCIRECTSVVRDIIKDETAPVAYHECGVPPNPDQCIQKGVMWSWWMIWHTTWLTGNDKEYLKYVFNHDLVSDAG